MKKTTNSYIPGVIRGLGLAGAACVAHIGIATTELWFSGADSLPAALVGTLCFAMVFMVVEGTSPYSPAPARCGVLHVVEFAVGAAACWVAYILTSLAVGDVEHFYCQPMVPWSIGIAIFGAFITALLLETVRRSRYQGTLEPAVFLSLFWISPFYGFFKAPVFLAQGTALGCEIRETNMLLAATICMWLSACIGKSLAGWLEKGTRKGD